MISEIKKYQILPSKLIVVHLAALANEKICARNKKKAYDVNVNGTVNLLKACSEKNVNNLYLLRQSGFTEKK